MDARNEDSHVFDQAAEDALAAAARERAAAAQDRRQAAADRAQARELLRRASEDDLTGVYLRGPGSLRLTHAVEQAHETEEPLCIAFIDADHLKLRNDKHGHAAGDALLREIGAALRASLRDYDIVVRYGGDEFVCAMPGIGRRDARRRLHDVAVALAKAVPGATISIGLVRLHEE